MNKYSTQQIEDDQALNKNEVIAQIEAMEAKIKEAKRNILHEREINVMLIEENQNLRNTNKIIDKGILQNLKTLSMTVSQESDEGEKNK